MSDINAGIVVMTEFCSASDSIFKGYIDYIDRDEATRKEHYSEFNIFDGYLDYMSNSKKTLNDSEKITGLFTNGSDFLSLDKKQQLKEVYQVAQDNGSMMWQTVISFDNAYLSKMGVYDIDAKVLNEKKVKQVGRKAINRMLESEGLGNATWSASIHYNTDNIHVHVATVEAYPMREKRMYKQYEKIKKDGKWRYKYKLNEITGRKEKIPILDQKGNHVEKMEYKGKFNRKSIRLCKRTVELELNQDKELNKEITAIIRERIIGGVRNKVLANDQELKKALMQLYEKLPADVSHNLWKYNTSIMKPYKKEIDKISSLYIEKYHKEDFERLQIDLELREAQYQEAYGAENNFTENKIDELYKRLGNAILRELRAYKHMELRDFEIKKGENINAVIETENSTEENIEKAVKWLEQSDDGNNAIAKYTLGKIFIDSKTKMFDPEKGLKYLTEAADDGYDVAQLKIGLMYLKGDILEKDVEAGRMWLNKSYNSGNIIAGEILSNMDKFEKMNISRIKISSFTTIDTFHNHDFDKAIAYLRRSMNRQYEMWKNQQEYDELQRKIEKSREVEEEL